MKVLEIRFTCYPVTDLPRARRFYEHVLGLKASRHFGTEALGFVEYDLGPCTLAVTNYSASDWHPSSGGGSAGLE